MVVPKVSSQKLLAAGLCQTGVANERSQRLYAINRRSRQNTIWSTIMRFVFVIPLVHPEHPRVKNYSTIEALLRLTLANIAGQTHDDVFAVVVCHKLPDWHKELEDYVHFLQFDDRCEFPLDVQRVRFHRLSHVDMGLKFVVGIAYAHSHLGASFIMPMDADDFVQGDLSRRIVTNSVTASGRDGWIITRGYHIEVGVSADQVILKAAYEVSNFNRNCGSCRVLNAESIAPKIASIAPDFYALHDLLPLGTPITIPNELTDALLSIIPDVHSVDSPLIVLADHIFQERLFDLRPLNEPLAAKGCGHGNHDARGGVYWYRVKRQVPMKQFISEFKVEESSLVMLEYAPVRHLWTFCKSWLSFFRQVGPSLIRRYRYRKAK